MIMAEEVGLSHGPIAAQMFGNAGKEHMEKYGTEFMKGKSALEQQTILGGYFAMRSI